MSDAVGLIYDTVAEPAAWSEAIQVMARDVRASASWLFKPGSNEVDAIAPHGIGRDVRETYARDFLDKDVLRQEGIRRWAETAGRAQREIDLVAEKDWLDSELYNDFAVPNGIGHVLAAPLGMQLGQGPLPILSFFRPLSKGQFDSGAVSQLGHLLPHLCRAVRLRDAISPQAAAPMPIWTASFLDRLSASVILLDGSGRLQYANINAQEILNQRDGLKLDRDGRLATSDAAAGRRLTVAIGRAISAIPNGSELQLPRGPGVLGRSWMASVTPLPAASAASFGKASIRCCVWIAGTHAVPSGTRLAALFGLTPAEQRVATGLLGDLSAEQVAHANRVSLATVRTQIRSIFAKLGVQRQAELIRLLAKIESLPIL